MLLFVQVPPSLLGVRQSKRSQEYLSENILLQLRQNTFFLYKNSNYFWKYDQPHEKYSLIFFWAKNMTWALLSFSNKNIHLSGQGIIPAQGNTGP